MEPTRQQLHALAAASQAATVQMPRFLIVDDQPAMRGTIRGMLRDMGFAEVEEAKDGELALKLLNSGRFDFVISGATLSDMDGLQLVTQVRHSGKPVSDTPVLLVGAQPQAQEVVRAAQCGADGFVVTPFTQATLEEKLQVIKRRFRCWPCQPRP